MNYLAEYKHHMSLWDSDDSFSGDKSQGSQKSGSEDENVSDDNVDEDQTSDKNMVLATGLNPRSHLENVGEMRLKNSFQQQKESEARHDQRPTSTQEFHFPTQSSAGAAFSLDDYQDSDQMVKDLMKYHNIEHEIAGLILIEQINDCLQGGAMKVSENRNNTEAPQVTLNHPH